MGLFRPTWWQPPRPGFIFSAVAGVAVTIAMSEGAVALSGQAPSLNKSLNPGTATLTFAGVAPSIAVSGAYTPATAALTLAGVAPTANTSNVYAVPSASLTFTGQTPTRTVGFVVLSPGTGSLSLDGGFTGVIFGGPDTGSLTLAGQTPLRVTTLVKSPPTGALTFSGPPVRLDFSPLIPSGSATFAGQAPVALVQSTTTLVVSPQTGTLTFSGTTLTIFKQIVCLPTTGSLTFTGQAISLYRLNPDTGSLTFSGQAPTARQAFFLTPQTGTLAFVGLAPSLQQTVASDLLFRPNSGELTFGGGTASSVVSSGSWQSGVARRIPGQHPIGRRR